MTFSSCSATYFVTHASDASSVAFSTSLKEFPPGTYCYKWTVTDETGKKYNLGGLSEEVNKRLSQYISTFNTKLTYRLSPLVRHPKNITKVEIFGPYGKEQDPAGLEKALIAWIKTIPDEENLNRTVGGNGGGAWAQYADQKPSVTTYNPADTPKKSYGFKKRTNGVISPNFSPGAKKVKAVFAITRKETGEPVYLGQSEDFARQASHLASLASHASPSKGSTPKVVEALKRSPHSYTVGALPSTIGQSPQSRRASLTAHLRDRVPRFNHGTSASGPAPMRKASIAKKLF